MKIFEVYWNSSKSMKIDGIPLKSMVIFVPIEEDGYAPYILRTQTPHMCLFQREIKCSSRENENWDFPDNIEFDVQSTGQSHSFDEDLKSSHGHLGHFAPSDFP